MDYYPVNLDIRNRHCLVVGGGSVGTRKVVSLYRCGARVTVVSPKISPALAELVAGRKVLWEQRDYCSEDLDGVFLVIGATNNERVNRQISEDAESRHRLCNIADRPEVCNFILPAIVRRGDLTIAVSTSGKSPALAKKVRQRLEGVFGPEYADLLRLMGAIRKKLLAQDHAPEAHKHLFETLLDGGILEMIQQGDQRAIDTLLADVLGDGFTTARLLEIESDE